MAINKLTVMLYGVVRVIDLIILTLFTGLLYGSGLWTVGKIRKQSVRTEDDEMLATLIYATLALVTINLLYQPLLINFRLWVKISYTSMGYIVFDAFNIVTCYPCLRYLCKTNSQWMFLRWITICAVLGATSYYSYKKQQTWESEFVVG